MRCLHCTKRGGHTAWCPGPGRPTPTTIMPAIQPDIRPAEMAVVTPSARMGAPAWAVVCVALGMILAGLSVVTLGALDAISKGGVTTMVVDQAKPSNGNERPHRPKPSGGNTRPSTG